MVPVVYNPFNAFDDMPIDTPIKTPVKSPRAKTDPMKKNTIVLTTLPATTPVKTTPKAEIETYEDSDNDGDTNHESDEKSEPSIKAIPSLLLEYISQRQNKKTINKAAAVPIIQEVPRKMTRSPGRTRNIH